MKKFLLISILLLLNSSYLLVNDFKNSQLKHPRVKQAFLDKGKCINEMLLNLNIKKVHIYIRAFKLEEKIEVWGKEKNENKFKLITSFPFCYSSGQLGPKRKQGDYQIPEGFYEIDRFNPKSNYHLSLGINYPNSSDRILSNANKLGGNIFIHGSCVTIGCIPITNDWIEELYILAVEAKNNGQVIIPVHIFPTKLSEENYQTLINGHYLEYDNSEFWLNLKEGYDYFENTHLLPNIEISDSGKYIIK